VDLAYGKILDTATAIECVCKTSELVVSVRQKVVEAPAERQFCAVHFAVVIRQVAAALQRG